MGDGWKDVVAQAEQIKSDEQAKVREIAQEYEAKIQELATGLDEEMQGLRKATPTVNSTLDSVLVHRFGGDIIRQPKRAEAYIRLGQKISDAAVVRGRVPVLLVYRTILPDGEAGVESALVATTQLRPFYSSYTAIPNQLLHAFTSRRADVMGAEMGLTGQAAICAGSIFSQSPEPDAKIFAEGGLMLNKTSLGVNGEGHRQGSDYVYSDFDIERLPNTEQEGLMEDQGRILVGWEEIEAAVLNERNVINRGRMARLLFNMTELVEGSPVYGTKGYLNKVFNVFSQELTARETAEELLANPAR